MSALTCDKDTNNMAATNNCNNKPPLRIGHGHECFNAIPTIKRVSMGNGIRDYVIKV